MAREGAVGLATICSPFDVQATFMALLNVPRTPVEGLAPGFLPNPLTSATLQDKLFLFNKCLLV
jgi:hypothetical protein